MTETSEHSRTVFDEQDSVTTNGTSEKESSFKPGQSIDKLPSSTRPDIKVDKSTALKPFGSRRGQGFSQIEDVLVCKAFIAASEDPIKGARQTQKDFQESIAAKYAELIEEQKKLDSFENPPEVEPIYPKRSGGSLHQRYLKTISPNVIKFMSILQTTASGAHKHKSGEDEDIYLARMCQLFEERLGKPFLFLECYKFLQDKSKFLKMKQVTDQKDEKSAKRKTSQETRPMGTKRAKQKAMMEALLAKKTKN